MSKNRFKVCASTAMLCLALGGCTPKSGETVAVISPSPSRTNVSAEATTLPNATPDSTTAVSLFDGRSADGKVSLPTASPADISTIENEVKRALGEERFQTEDFEVRAGGEGSFTRMGAKEKIFLYRFGATNGVVVLEDSTVLAHYTGGPGDYAFYTYLVPRDVNRDGLSDLILFRNVEDNEDILAYLFLTSLEGPTYAGSATVYSSTVQGGEENDPGEAESRAFELKMAEGAATTYLVSEFQRKGQGEWETVSTSQPFSWEEPKEDDYRPKFVNLLKHGTDLAKIQSALDRLQDYSDVPSSIDITNPKNPAQKLVADDPVLQMMELLDTRAAVYAVENATKTQVDHSDVGKYALTLEGLGTADEIRDAFIRHTNDSLGGMSPYADASR